MVLNILFLTNNDSQKFENYKVFKRTGYMQTI